MRWEAGEERGGSRIPKAGGARKSHKNFCSIVNILQSQ